MATVNCLKCKKRPAIDSCIICRNPLCGECMVRCQVCKKIVCKNHHGVTTTGRKLCDECMQQRAKLRAERKERKERERKPMQNMSFEALSDKESAESVPVQSTSFEPPEVDAEESSSEAPVSPPAPTSFAADEDDDAMRMPVDENRPILSASAGQRTSRWVYVVPVIVALVIIYFVVTQLFTAFSFL